MHHTESLTCASRACNSSKQQQLALHVDDLTLHAAGTTRRATTQAAAPDAGRTPIIIPAASKRAANSSQEKKASKIALAAHSPISRWARPWELIVDERGSSTAAKSLVACVGVKSALFHSLAHGCLQLLPLARVMEDAGLPVAARAIRHSPFAGLPMTEARCPPLLQSRPG